VEAIRRGVKKVIIMDGRVPHSILMELLTDEGAGTMVKGASSMNEEQHRDNQSGMRNEE